MEEPSDDIKAKIDFLVEKLNQCNYEYHVLDAPSISDEDYDMQFRHLRELESQTGYTPPQLTIVKGRRSAFG